MVTLGHSSDPGAILFRNPFQTGLLLLRAITVRAPQATPDTPGGTMRTRISKFTSTDKGATAVEYGLMVALIAIVIIGSVTLLGTNLNALFAAVAAAI